MNFNINGNLGSTFSAAFSRASSSMSGLSSEAKETQRSLNRLGKQFREGKIDEEQYAVETERLTAQLKRLKMTQQGMNGLRSQFSSGLKTAGTVASIAAIGTAAGVTRTAINSIDVAAGFEQEMTKVGVISGATSIKMNELRDTALDLGANSSKSATEVAYAMENLSSKGMDADETMKAMPGILAASEAAGEDLATTSDVVVSAINAFGLKAGDAAHIADVMAMSANKTAADIEGLGYSFKYAAPLAQLLGISLEELAATTGVMMDAGLRGEQAGTTLRMAMIRLAKPTKMSQKALDELGLSAVDAEGNFKSITEITREWNEATKDLTETQQLAYAATIFGTEASSGMIKLFGEGADAIDSVTQSLKNSTGAAERAATTMRNTYGGALEDLSGSIETAKIAFMTPILPEFKELYSGIGSGIDANIPAIEEAGEHVANVLEEAFSPFTSRKPEMPTFQDSGGNQEMFEQAMKEYDENLAKYDKFKDMNLGDKTVYALDEITAATEEWLDGPGGDAMNSIFTSLAEIAGHAWMSTFKSSFTGIFSNTAQGNFGTALIDIALFRMLGGGLLLKGAGNLTKTVRGFIGKRRGTGVAIPSTSQTSTIAEALPGYAANNPSNRARGRNSNTSSVNRTPIGQSGPTVAAATAAETEAAATGILGKSTKLLGKAAIPVTLVTGAASIAESDDKVKTTTEVAGGVAGGIGGAELGATIGTMILPGIGTAIGTALGGVIGGWGGNKVAGGAVDVVRGDTGEQSTDVVAAQVTDLQASLPTVDQIETLKSSVYESVTESTTAMKESALGFKALKESTTLAKGWIDSLESIEIQGKKVTKSLKKVKKKLDNFEMPTFDTSKERTSYHS